MLIRKGIFQYNEELILEIQCGIYERSIWVWVLEKGTRYKSTINVGSLINTDQVDIATILTQRYGVPVIVNQEISEDMLVSERNIWLLESIVGLIEGTADIRYVEQDSFSIPEAFEGNNIYEVRVTI